MFILKPYDVVRDPLYRYIEFTEAEKMIIDTWPLQRLRDIKQVPGAAYVYPSATHTRFSHSLGAMHVAGEMCEHLMREKWINGSKKEREEIEKKVQKIRLAGLLHDVGHGPFSHVFEFGFLDQGQRKKYNHERMAEKIIGSGLKEVLTSDKIGLTETDVEDIKKWALKIPPPDEKEYFPYQIVADRTSKIDADKFDYLLRDAHHTGTIEYGMIDIERLILNSKIIEIDDKLSVGFHERVKFSLLNLWLARYSMFHTVYYHRTTRSVELMIGLLLKRLNDEQGILTEALDDLKIYLTLTDGIMDYTRRLPLASTAKEISDRIDCRDLIKPTLDISIPEKDRFKCKSLLALKEEHKEEIAKYASLDKSEIVLDFPTIDSPFYPTPLIEIPFYSDDKKIKFIPLEDIGILQASGRYELTIRVYAVNEKNRTAVKKAAQKWAKKWDLKFTRISAFEGLSV